MDETSKALSGILGKKIEKIDQSIGYVNIKFASGGDLTIYNTVVMIESKSTTLDAIIGSYVERVFENSERVEIYFDNGLGIKIDLTYDPSRGIESMQLVMPGRPIVVWN